MKAEPNQPRTEAGIREQTLRSLPRAIQEFAGQITTIGDRVLLLRCESTLTAWKSEAGLVAPDIAKERPQEAIVLVVGDGRRLDNGELVPLFLKPGDRVVHSKFPGLEISFPAISDTPFIICREDECLARIK
jgi:chaperonin GroES